MDTAYTFTRNSIAYLSNGTQVAANKPRFEQGAPGFGKAVMVEEGTTNLVQNPTFASTSNWQLVTDGTGTFSVADNWGEINVPQGETGKYYYLQQEIVTTVPAGTKVTFSLVFRNNIAGTCAIRTVMYSGDPPPVVVEQSNVVLDGSGIPEKHSMSTVYDAADCNKVRIDIMTGSYYTGLSDISIEFTKAQLEIKPYATSFIDGTRAGETIQIPAAVWNRDSWQMDMIFVPTSKMDAGYYNYLFRLYIDSNNSYSLIIHATGRPYIAIRSGGTERNTYSASDPVLEVGQKYHLSAKGDGNTMALFINGQLSAAGKVSYVKPVGDLPEYLYVGSNQAGSQQSNGLIDDVRISNRARTDEEILEAYQSNKPLPIDQWTTAKLEFEPDIFPVLSHEEYNIDLSTEEYIVSLNHETYEIRLEVIGLAYAGSTITLKATFPDNAGDLQDLEDVTVKIYAPGKVLVETLSATFISTGVYAADYLIPGDKAGEYDYEFSGTLGSKTIVGRSSFDAHWR